MDGWMEDVVTHKLAKCPAFEGTFPVNSAIKCPFWNITNLSAFYKWAECEKVLCRFPLITHQISWVHQWNKVCSLASGWNVLQQVSPVHLNPKSRAHKSGSCDNIHSHLLMCESQKCIKENEHSSVSSCSLWESEVAVSRKLSIQSLAQHEFCRTHLAWNFRSVFSV